MARKYALVLLAALSLPLGAFPLHSDFNGWKKELGEIISPIRAVNPSIEFSSMPIDGNENSLSIDYLYIPPSKENRNLVILNSGIHGVEAPAGVFLQHQVLKNWLKDSGGFNGEKTGLLIIHVMNPHGAIFGRRYNRDNIDLNRNCFDHRLSEKNGFPGLAIRNKEYEELKNFLNSRLSTFDIVMKGVFKGKNALAKSLGGQYHDPKGINFGGQKVASECVRVQDLMRRKIEPYTNVAILDIHTGLGKKGIHQVLLRPHILPKELALVKMLFPPRECKNLCEIQQAHEQDYQTTGDFTQWVYQNFPQKRAEGVIISVTSEIGTKSGITVLKRLVNENYCYGNPQDCSPREMARETAKLRKVFTLSEDHYWVHQVNKIGVQFWTMLKRFSQM